MPSIKDIIYGFLKFVHPCIIIITIKLSSSLFLDIKKELTSVFRDTATSVESTSSLRGFIDAKGSKGSSPFVLFIKAYSIYAASLSLEVIFLPSNNVR